MWDIGTATFTNSSKVVTKTTGQDWTNPLVGVAPSRAIIDADGNWFEIEYVISANELWIRDNYTGTTGVKAYRVPTSPNVPIEAFATEQAAFVEYLRMLTNAWQAITTGSGNVTITDPITGQQITVTSLQQWNDELDGKMNLGQYGFGGIGETVNLNAADFITFLQSDATPTQVIRNDADATHLPMYSPCLVMKAGDTWAAWCAGISPQTATLAGVKVVTGNSSGTITSTYNIWTDINLANPYGKGFVSNDRSELYSNEADLLAKYASHQSMGSSQLGDSGPWITAISVRHRGGNSINEGSADSSQWGWILYDDQMVSTNASFKIRKQYEGVWQTAYSLYHTGNVTVDSSGSLKAASPIVKLFRDGTSELSAEAEGVTTERLEEGVYRISGCLGMNADALWSGTDGGIANPKCRNDLPLIWNDYDVEEDGSIIVRTYHRPHPDAPAFAQNLIEGYESGDPIDVPVGTFVMVRVQMPESEQPKYQPVVEENAQEEGEAEQTDGE